MNEWIAVSVIGRDGFGCAKLGVFANMPEDNPFMAGAYLGYGEPECVINVGVSGPGVVKKELERAIQSGKKLTLGDLTTFSFPIPWAQAQATNSDISGSLIRTG